MFIDFIVFNFTPLVGLLFLMVFLISEKAMNREIRYIFLFLSLMEVVELIVYNLELETASFVEPTLWRTLLSAVGYSIRPFLVFGIFKLNVHTGISDKKMRIFAIPAIVNVIVAFSAFFTDVVYSYNEKNEFVRGPLGYVPHIVLFFYLICILVLSIKKDGKEHHLESIIVWAICLVIVFAVVVEAMFSVRSLGRTAIVLSTIAYYLYFQTQNYREGIRGYMEQTILSQKEHLREMNIIGVLAKEYVTVCYVDVEKNIVTPYRMDPFIEKQYGDVLRSGVGFEKIFRAYVLQDIYEEDREFFLNLADLEQMSAYLQEKGSLSQKYRVMRDGEVLYCEMRAEFVDTGTGIKDIVFGFSNNDTRVRKEMVYQNTMQQEMEKVNEAKASLSGIADLAKQLQEAIEEKLSIL